MLIFQIYITLFGIRFFILKKLVVLLGLNFFFQFINIRNFNLIFLSCEFKLNVFD